MDFEISFLNENVRPYTRDQVFFADNLSRSFNQARQNLKRATADLDRLAGLEEQLLRGNEDEWPERDHPVERRIDRISHSDSLSWKIAGRSGTISARRSIFQFSINSFRSHNAKDRPSPAPRHSQIEDGKLMER
jgi:hypothetical protein